MKALLVRSLTLVAVAIAMPATAIAQTATHNWAGFYAGLNAGRTWGGDNVGFGCSDPDSPFFDTTPDCSLLIGNGTFPRGMSTDLGGSIGGGQAGYNLQSGNLVFGVETDFSWTSANDSDSSSPEPPPLFFPQSAKVSQDLEWFGTLRGRVGYAAGNWLVFATGGLAYGKVGTSFEFSCPGCFVSGAFAEGSQSNVETGWTAGGGGEIAFGQWSLKGEYLYFDLGDQDLSAAQFGPSALVPIFAVSHSADFDTQGQIARIGLNFHFD